MSLNIKKAIGASFFALILTAMFIGFVPTVKADTRAAQLEQIQMLLKVVAQLQTQLEQMRLQGNSGEQCVPLSRSLSLGSSDKDTAGSVSSLQRYLSSTGHYTYGEITGYFGPVTSQAVQAWQVANRVIVSGSPETAGYGAVGPKTMGMMAEVMCSPTAQSVAGLYRMLSVGSSLENIPFPGIDSDFIDGGEDTDTVSYGGNRSNYTLYNGKEYPSKNYYDVIFVKDNSNGSIDTIVNVELLQFSDQKLSVPDFEVVLEESA